MNTATSKIIKASCLAATLAAGSGAAHAGPIGSVGLEMNNPLFPAGSDTLKVTLDGATKKVRAGLFGATATRDNAIGDFDPDSLHRSGNDVLLYCVDLLDNLIKADTSYNVYDVAAGVIRDATSGSQRNFGRLLEFLGGVNTVMGSTTGKGSGYTYGDQNWLEVDAAKDGWLAGAIQVGIWESLYETDDKLDLKTGLFSVWDVGNGSNKLHTDGDAFLTAAFGAMDSSQALDASLVKRFVPTETTGNVRRELNGQELIGDPTPVPVPASVVLVLSGLGLLARRLRRDRF